MRNTMKKVKLFLSILISLYSIKAFSQEDSWDVYLAQYEKGPGSTLINMSAKKYAPKSDLPFVVITGVTFKDCTPQGMPTENQFPELYKISDSISDILKTKTLNVSVATFTYQCERLEYFYAKDTFGLRDALMTLYSRSFKNYKSYINFREDKSWSTYLEFLYPNDETFEFMKNQKVLSKLYDSGDNHEKARQVDHWIYFSTEQDRDCFVKYVTYQNFKIEEQEKLNTSKMAYKLHISRNDKINIEAISKITLELKKHAESCNGDYDGWETFVVK